MEGKDSVRIANGDITITSQKDGIHSDNSEDTTKGFVYLLDGKINITSEGDGIDASNIVQLDGATMDITTGGGSKNGKTHTPDGGGKGGGGNMPGGTPPTEMGERPEGNPPTEMGERPEENPPTEMEQMPEQQQNNNGIENSEDASEDTTEEDTVSTKGIKADIAILFNSGKITVNSADDSLHSNGVIQVNDGECEVASGDDGVHADGAVDIEGGTINVTESYEGIEGETITVNGGDIKANSSDDGFNAADGSVSSNEMRKSDNCYIEINAGDIYVNASGDGLDSNGDLRITGGNVYVDGPVSGGDSAIDYGDGAVATISGGNLVAVGSSGMAESFSDSSKQSVMLVVTGTDMIEGKVTLKDSNGKEILSYEPSKSYNCVIISNDSLKKGETYTLETGDVTTTVEFTENMYSNNPSTRGNL